MNGGFFSRSAPISCASSNFNPHRLSSARCKEYLLDPFAILCIRIVLSVSHDSVVEARDDA